MALAQNVLDGFSLRVTPRHQLLITEAMKQSQKQKTAYHDWLAEGKYLAISQSVFNNYQKKENYANTLTDLHLFNTESTKGISIVLNRGLSVEDSNHYFAYLKTRLIELGYSLQHAYRELIDQALHVEMMDKYFLHVKNTEVSSTKTSQCYGDLTLEYIQVDNVPSHIKILVMNADKRYNSTLRFNRLMSALFEF